MDPQTGDPQHITLKKILARLNDPVTRPVISDPDDSPVNVIVDNTDLDVRVSNNNLDAFGRLRISDPSVELEAKHTLDYNTNWSNLTSGSGSGQYISARQSWRLAVNPDVAVGTSLHQTMRRAYYQPGKSQLMLTTFTVSERTLEPSPEKVQWELGMGDSGSGVFLGGTGNPDASMADMWFKIRGNTNTTVLRSDWSFDKLDGTGPSGKTLTLYNRTQIFWADAEWLGVGSVRFGFVIDGQFIHCHTIHHANTSVTNSPYTPSLNYPLRAYVEATSTYGSDTTFALEMICGTIISEGGFEKVGTPACVRRPGTGLVGSTTAIYPIIGWRLNYANYPNARHSIVDLDSISAASDNSLFEVMIYRNPTLTGTAPVWTQNGQALEMCQTTTNATTVTGGTPLWSNIVGGTNAGASMNSEIARTFRLGISGDNVPEPLWICMRRLAGQNVLFFATANLSLHN